MRVRLLPSNIDATGRATRRQHLTSFIFNGNVALDAGSLAFAISDEERKQVRDIVLTHAHLDHIAGLPLFVDDLFATLDGPIRVHAPREVIETLETNIFNWAVYPRFSELENEFGKVLEYHPIEDGACFEVQGLCFKPLTVNHKVPTRGYLVSDGGGSIAVTGDTAELKEFWEAVNELAGLKALLVECAFPNELDGIARVSYHLTPKRLLEQLDLFTRDDAKIFVINIKPSYREAVVGQLKGDERLEILESGREYVF